MGYAYEKWGDLMIFVKCNYWKLIEYEKFVTITVEKKYPISENKKKSQKKICPAQTPKNAASVD